MRMIVFFLGAAVSLVSGAADEDEWLGESDYGGYLGFRYGVYEDDAKNYSVNSTLPLFWHSQLNVILSKYRADYGAERQTSEQWGIYFNTDPLQTFLLGFGYEKNGKGSSIESEDAHVYLQFSINEYWSFRAKYLRGDIDLRYEGLSDNVEEQFRALGLLSRERDGMGLSINYDNLYWGLRFSANDYDYQGDGGPEVESSQALNQLLMQEASGEARFWLGVYYLLLYETQLARGVDERAAIDNVNNFFTAFEAEIIARTEAWIDRRAQEKREQNLVYYRYAYGQHNLLSKRDFSLDAYWVNAAITYSMGVLTYQSYIDEEYASQIYGGVDYQFSDHHSVGALVSYSDEYSDLYAELSLGFNW